MDKMNKFNIAKKLPKDEEIIEAQTIAMEATSTFYFLVNKLLLK